MPYPIVDIAKMAGVKQRAMLGRIKRHGLKTFYARVPGNRHKLLCMSEDDVHWLKQNNWLIGAPRLPVSLNRQYHGIAEYVINDTEWSVIVANDEYLRKPLCPAS